MLQITSLVFVIVIAYYIVARNWRWIQYERKRRSRGCGSVKYYAHKDPFFGLDYIYAMFSNLKQNRFLEYQKELYSTAAQGGKTFSANFCGTRMVFSSEDENMKAMSTSMWKDFGVQPIRQGNGALKPLGTHGASSTDGKLWEYSRELIKPYFNRQEYAALSRLDKHMDRVIELVPKDGTAIDLQPLFQRWFFDNSTDLLFGESADSQLYPERFGIAQDMIKIMQGLRIRLQLTKMLWLHRDKAWFDAVKRVHQFLDKHIYRARADYEKEIATGVKPKDPQGNPRTDLLYTILPNGPTDHEALRSQILNVFFSSNETTSILIANIFFELARHPRVYAKLREEALAQGDVPLTFEKLRSMPYLRYVVNEVHRFRPISLQTIRVALNDTTLPRGGGPDGNLPIFIQKGDIMHCNRYLMHRDVEYWGKDAEEFVPERWKTARPLWKFVPFGGGPRICPAHVLVDTETSYMVYKFARTFEKIEARDDRPYTAVMRAGPSNLHGVKVACFA